MCRNTVKVERKAEALSFYKDSCQYTDIHMCMCVYVY